MNPALLSAILDVAVAILLIATIAYTIRLNRQLVALRADRDRLTELIAGLQEATRAAEEGVRELKLSAAETGRELQAAVNGAGTLRDDLAFLVERGGSIANRIEGAMRGRNEEAATATPVRPRPQMALPPEPEVKSGQRREPVLDPARATSPPVAEPALQSRAERDLLRALEARR